MNIIFSAGGTGGHLYPALALASYIKSQDSSSQILFIGSNYRIEATKVSEYGFMFKGLNIKTPSGSLLKKVIGYKDVLLKIKECQKIIKEFKPDVVIGFGGYTSYSVLKASERLKIPYYLHEQNSIIGKANLTLLNKAQGLICAYPLELKTNTPLHLLGNPTSYQIKKSSIANLNDYGLSNDLPTLLIMMGSQGSMIVDEFIYDMIVHYDDNYQLIYVCGNNYYDRYHKLKLNDKVKVIAYENNMPSLIKACTLIVSRAGASALSEIISANKPALLIPSIHVTNNHQYHNASLLVKNECALIINEAELSRNLLSTKINELLNDHDLLVKMIENTKKFNYDDSAMLIYQLLKNEIGDNIEK
ncbi:MAG: UDP-N-acetylglucosamine--N-acetylmuramyl-(pentapeptide) pyrophosphoryl-undecaprenol N-acetylglucosamine transferase [Bacilli bacterium]|jgi:UDP-N-acetylglucosamine--N-acetylmuramyl-(pentapeptide) pyrophosphoryl-undecaprenol N-acetylglucosamine transferase|nr:UDP-N-acetylglucosamine--N-acetylmuramyl-(pentapeptide) pyrophosphoryl-undecaprenol N-acetylglucosamine transferase [Bacilli bacterium]